MKSIDNREKIAALMEKRKQFPELVKKHIEYTLIGFEKTLNFISESKEKIITEYRNNTAPTAAQKQAGGML